MEMNQSNRRGPWMKPRGGFEVPYRCHLPVPGHHWRKERKVGFFHPQNQSIDAWPVQLVGGLNTAGKGPSLLCEKSSRSFAHRPSPSDDIDPVPSTDCLRRVEPNLHLAFPSAPHPHPHLHLFRPFGVRWTAVYTVVLLVAQENPSPKTASSIPS